MNDFFKRKNEIKKVLDKCIATCKDEGFQVAKEELIRLKESFTNRELKIVVVGEARRGKSTLLNALLGLDKEHYVFPVNIEVTTNVVTIVRYGEKEEIKVIISDDKAPEGVRVESIKKNEIQNYVTESGNPGNYRNVRCLEISLPNELLKEGVVIVDTPGVGSLNVEHAEITYGYLPQADLMLFVGDATAGFTESELKLLKRGYQFCRNVISPLTKIDLNDNYSVIEEDNRKKISSTLEIPEDTIKVVPISAQAKIDSITYGEEFMLEISNFNEFENILWNTVTEIKGDIFFTPYLNDAEAIIIEQLDRIVAQYQLIKSEDVAKVEEAKKEMKAKSDQLNVLLSDSAQWQTELNVFFANMNSDIVTSNQNLKTSLTHKLNEYFGNTSGNMCREENYKNLLEKMNDRMISFCIDTQNSLDQKVKHEMENVYEKLKLGSYEMRTIVNDIGFKPEGNLPVKPVSEKRYRDKVADVGRKVGRGVRNGALIGGGISSLAGGAAGLATFFITGGNPILAVYVGTNVAAIGSAAGTTIGTVKGVCDVINGCDANSIRELKNAFNQYMSESVGTISSSCKRYLNELQIRNVNGFKTILKGKSVELKEQIEALGKAMKASKTGRKDVLIEIQEQNRKFKELDEEIESLQKSLEVSMHEQKEVANENKDDIPANDCAEGKSGMYDFL